MAIKLRLNRRMGELRMCQADLVRKTGIRKGTIHELYNDLSQYISRENLDKICDALHCSLYDIIEWQPNEGVEYVSPHWEPLPIKVEFSGKVVLVQEESTKKTTR